MTHGSLPAATPFTPGYEWRLDLDVKFDGVRPDDWQDWTVRMHVWTSAGPLFTLDGEDGVTVEEIDDLPGADGPIAIPVIRLSPERTEQLRFLGSVAMLIDVQAPGDEVIPLFDGQLTEQTAPPAEML